VKKCRDDLQALRTKINSTCKKAADVMVYQDTAYPATFLVDKYLYTYDVSCYKDKSVLQLD
jgi:hypothetical protein